jgi:putative ATP-dependent endonuclease of OLD family
MRIIRIEVRNHSRVEDFDVEVRGHAVIVGANDVGKSSILRLLNLLLGASTGQLFQQLSVADVADHTQELLVEVTLDDFTDVERTLFPAEISVAPDDYTESMRVQLAVAVDEDDAETVTIRRWFPEGGHPRPPTRDQLVAFGWRYLPATRGASATALEGPASALQSLLKAIDLGTEKATLTELLDKFNVMLEQSTAIQQLRTTAAGHLSRAMPRPISDSDLAVRTSTDPTDDTLGNVAMFFERDGKYVSLSEQSDGLRQLMAMTFFDLAEGAANIVAIDEPELHLHPTSQRTIAELFVHSANQKILVTHSPYVVQRFEPSHVIAVGPDRKCHQIASDKLATIDKVRASWWSPRLLEALTARHVLIVEGTSDRIIVEGAARALDVSLDRLGAVVLDIDGADKFKHVYKLLGPNGFNIPILGLVDEAEKASWHTQVGGKQNKVFGSVLWVSNPDLEGAYCSDLTAPACARMLVSSGLFREDGIMQSCGVTVLGDVKPEPLATFCRANKVEAARSIADQLDSTTAPKLAAVHGLLGKLCTLAAQ